MSDLVKEIGLNAGRRWGGGEGGGIGAGRWRVDHLRNQKCPSLMSRRGRVVEQK